MKFYHFYNLPKPPEKYINLALTKEEENFGSRSEYNVPVLDKVNRYGQLITPNRNWRHELDKDFYKWVKENITLNFFDASIAMNIRENGYVTPHTDAKRNWCLIYVLDSGGDSCRTCF